MTEKSKEKLLSNISDVSIEQNSMLLDLLIRLSSIETLLLKNNILSKEDYMNQVTESVDKIKEELKKQAALKIVDDIVDNIISAKN